MNAQVELLHHKGMKNHPLYLALKGVREAHPKAGMRAWSQWLATPEGEIQASRVGREKVWPLQDVFSICYRLAALKQVEVCTVNACGWHVSRGQFSAPDLYLDDPHRLGLQFRLGQRRLLLMLDHWYWGCAVEEAGEQPQNLSLQFFDRQGHLLLKVQAVEGTDLDAWASLVDAFADYQNASRPLFAATAGQAETGGEVLDPEALSLAWRRAPDRTVLNRLIGQQGGDYLAVISRLDVGLARGVAPSSLQHLLRQVIQLPSHPNHRPQLVFNLVSQGCQSTLTGQPIRLGSTQDRDCSGWSGASACVLLSQLDQAFVVRKPGAGAGWQTYLEVFDAWGRLALSLTPSIDSKQAESLVLRDMINSLT